MSVKAGSFVTTGAAAGNTIAVTGVGFTPKAVFFFWSSRDTNVDIIVSQDLLGWGYAFAVSPTERGGVSVAADDNQSTTSREDTRTFNDGVVSSIALGTAAETGRLDLQSMDADGFTLIIDDQFPATSDGMRVNYIAIGEDAISNAKIGEFRTNAGTGNQAITGVGFKPDAVFFITGMATGAAALPQANAHVGIAFGAAISSSERYVSAIMAENNRDLTTLVHKTRNYSYDGECIASFDGGGSLNCRADFVSLDADGFTINILEAGVRRQIQYLAVKGGNWKLFDGLTLTSAADLGGIDVGFEAEGGMIVSTMSAKNAQDASAGEAEMDFGAFEAAGSQRIISNLWRNLDPTNTGLGQDDTRVYMRINNAFSFDGLMLFKEMSGDEIIFTMGDADPSAAFFWGFAVTSAPPVGVKAAPIFFP